MKVYVKNSVITLVIALQMFAAAVFSQDNFQVNPVNKKESSAPAAEDEVLKRRIGTWDATIEIQISDGKAPVKSKGIEKDYLTPDGHWLISEFEGELFGRSFTGHAITGFDPAKNKYVGVWIDSMRRHLSLVEGEYDAKGKFFTTISQDKDDQSGRMIEMKQVTDESDPNVRIVSFPSPVMGGRSLSKMTITYVRRP